MEQLASGDPRRIGAYRLLARLGAGGMGQVYLARSDRGRTVAVKLVRRELAEQEEFRSRFRQEVAAARRVGGAWTAPVLDADTEAEVPWVATGYVAGPSLHSVISGGQGGPAHGPLPEHSVRTLAAGLARALTDIHSAGIVHRDLKPSNVLITIDGPRVIDFGIARALETVADGGLTRTGALVGSPGFMAPEQVRGDRITPACDVFCLGSVLAYAAGGRLPFGSADSGVHAQMFRIAEEEPDLSGVPESLRELIRDCLHKEPGARPTLELIRERAGGVSKDSSVPWLPGALIAQLGSHAVKLLEVEHPESFTDATGAGPAAGAPAPGSGPHAPGAAQPPPAPGPAAHGVAAQGSPAQFPVDGARAAAGGTPPPGDLSAASGRPGAAPGAPGVHALPTMAGPPTPPPGPAPTPAPSPPPGWAAHHPAPVPHTLHSAAPPYGTYPQYGPPSVPGAQRGDRRGTVALVAVAVVVAVAAGSSVYALMNGEHTSSPAAPGPSTSAPRSPGTSGGSGGPTADDTPATTESSPTARAGTVPEEYTGTWQAEFTTADGSTNTRIMTITSGSAGDTVMTLTGRGANYDCRWSATLRASGPPLELGPTQVTFGDRRSCSPGQWSRLDMPDDRTIVRELVGSGGAPLTYTKVD
ncbi:serine/threonine-protein kinase [Streptomyces sp. WMMC940]|uniref:serine/threonine-protein kinase n=1 Tax=Streptomyces sp. WMMC940 TaxID=3015153 RepID=UPI0022B682C2|nr:serine/threonine-protein kinase [Streptomyces sp. WMMC940]MCZ7458973.1 serine/threonine-protein kinase [Streptomyces sp. WMMC940]